MRANPMATPHSRIVVWFIQWRRRVARNRMKRDLGWKPAWDLIRGRG